MKKFSKKNFKKTKVSKKNKTKLQRGGKFETNMADNIKIIEEIMLTTKDKDGNPLTFKDENQNQMSIYKLPAHQAYQKLSRVIHPDKHTNEKDKYTGLFQVISDFNTWIKDNKLSPETTWIQAINAAKTFVQTTLSSQSSHKPPHSSYMPPHPSYVPPPPSPPPTPRKETYYDKYRKNEMLIIGKFVNRNAVEQPLPIKDNTFAYAISKFPKNHSSTYEHLKTFILDCSKSKNSGITPDNYDNLKIQDLPDIFKKYTLDNHIHYEPSSNVYYLINDLENFNSLTKDAKLKISDLITYTTSLDNQRNITVTLLKELEDLFKKKKIDTDDIGFIELQNYVDKESIITYDEFLRLYQSINYINGYIYSLHTSNSATYSKISKLKTIKDLYLYLIDKGGNVINITNIEETTKAPQRGVSDSKKKEKGPEIGKKKKEANEANEANKANEDLSEYNVLSKKNVREAKEFTAKEEKELQNSYFSKAFKWWYKK